MGHGRDRLERSSERRRSNVIQLINLSFSRSSSDDFAVKRRDKRANRGFLVAFLFLFSYQGGDFCFVRLEHCQEATNRDSSFINNTNNTQQRFSFVVGKIAFHTACSDCLLTSVGKGFVGWIGNGS